jgi:hypothetical protein
MNKITLWEYVNVSGYFGGGWIACLTGYDIHANEYRLELDLSEIARKNWDRFKEKYVMKNSKSFYEEFERAKKRTCKEREHK